MGFGAQAKYDKTHTKKIIVKLNLQYDADIIERIAEKGFQPYVKVLIRADIEKEHDSYRQRVSICETERSDGHESA